MRGVIKNVFWAVLGNGFSLFTTASTLFLIPMFLNVKEYGYIQLYAFYIGYLGLFNLGWLEGIYLKLGGFLFEDLDKRTIKAQYKVFKMYTLTVCSTLVLMSMVFIGPIDKKMLFILVSFCIIPVSRRYYWDNLLLCCGEIKLYTRSCIVEKVCYLSFVITLILSNTKNIFLFILADILAKCFGWLFSSLACKTIWRNNIEVVLNAKIYVEIRNNIKSGINLLIANLSSTLIVGSFKIAIETNWNIEVFSQMSLTLSLSAFVLGFINAISQVLYTFLKRSTGENRNKFYGIMRIAITVLALGTCVFFFPFKLLLIGILPEYEFGLQYMAILLPIGFIECKWSFLTLTYLKAMRGEKAILFVNIISMLIAALLACITVFILHDLFLTVISIVLVLFIRSTLGELMLCKMIKIKVFKKIILEGIVIVFFVIINWYIKSFIAIPLCSIVFACYLLLEKDDCVILFKTISLLVKRKVHK